MDQLRKLLAKDPSVRIKTVEDIKRHPWLKSTDWDAFTNKEIEPPFIPSMRETNFDAEFDNMPLDIDDSELRVRKSTERR